MDGDDRETMAWLAQAQQFLDWQGEAVRREVLAYARWLLEAVEAADFVAPAVRARKDGGVVLAWRGQARGLDLILTEPDWYDFTRRRCRGGKTSVLGRGRAERRPIDSLRGLVRWLRTGDDDALDLTEEDDR